jgi:hypothetical protein
MPRVAMQKYTGGGSYLGTITADAWRPITGALITTQRPADQGNLESKLALIEILSVMAELAGEGI